MKCLPWSFSSSETFLQCPLKFYYTRTKPAKVRSPALARGSTIHSKIENYITNYFKNQSPEPQNPLDQNAKKFEVFLENFKDKYLQGTKKQDSIESLVCSDQNVVLSEVKFGISKNIKAENSVDFEPQAYGNANFFRGIIDFILYRPKQKDLIIIDFKTGKKPSEPLRQLEIYSEVLKIYFKGYEHNIQTLKTIYLYIDQNDSHSKVLNFNDIGTQNLKHLISLTEEFENQNSKGFEKKINKFCPWCPYKELCASEASKAPEASKAKANILDF